MNMLSRQEASAELVDGAIEAWLSGRYACAITLAGAAETGMPKAENGVSMFDAMRAAVMKFGKCKEGKAADVMNTSRNWLKHFHEDKPEHISVEYAWVYVLRAYWQFRAVYKDAKPTPNMVLFQEKLEEKTRPLQEAMDGFIAWLQKLGDAFSGTLPPPKR